jgi:flagellar biosynthesis/type III secretory pathway M-ring protein FliF/YscJ
VEAERGAHSATHPKKVKKPKKQNKKHYTPDQSKSKGPYQSNQTEEEKHTGDSAGKAPLPQRLPNKQQRQLTCFQPQQRTHLMLPAASANPPL